ncbi:MAG: hypothetical protein HQM03_07195 [Magnetococcales bacterium]|nr:hypothetical protein [Magnetococcales bacterium]MBF0179797.1 hypothetical protein [Magnetococcales bacterium]
MAELLAGSIKDLQAGRKRFVPMTPEEIEREDAELARTAEGRRVLAAYRRGARMGGYVRRKIIDVPDGEPRIWGWTP